MISRRDFVRGSAAAAAGLGAGRLTKAQQSGVQSGAGDAQAKAADAAGGAGAASATAGAKLPPMLPVKRFEVSASLYAWDLHDEGVERVLDNVEGMAAVNSVYLIGLMHPERRPLTSGAFPHNPARTFWMAEDARAYWHFDPKRYGRIKPRLSDFDWLNQTDWMHVLADAARRRGLRLGMEFSHALCDKMRVEGEFADVAERDIHGDITHVRNWLRPICPNHPDTREYAVAAFTEVVEEYKLDWVESCIVSMDEAVGGSPQRGGCFCDACKRAAKGMGVDLDHIQKALLADPAAQPELGQWIQFRFDSVDNFYKAIHAAVRKARPGIEVRYNMHAKNPRDWGVDIVQLKPQIDSLRIMDYSEQTGQAAAMDGKRAWLDQERGALGAEFDIVSAVAVRPRATPELIREGVKIAVDGKMNGITLGHYDGAEFPMLRAIREGLGAAGVPVAAAI